MHTKKVDSFAFLSMLGGLNGYNKKIMKNCFRGSMNEDCKERKENSRT